MDELNLSEKVASELLSMEYIEEFINQNYVGDVTKSLVRETLVSYVNFLRRQNDFILEQLTMKALEKEAKKHTDR